MKYLISSDNTVILQCAGIGITIYVIYSDLETLKTNSAGLKKKEFTRILHRCSVRTNRLKRKSSQVHETC